MFLEVQNLSKRFEVNREKIDALQDVSLEIPEGGIVGILGQSGSGKTTLGQIIAGLQRPTGGRVLVNGNPVTIPYPKKIRRQIQILFQQPEASFNPRRTLWESLREPYRLYGLPISRDILCADLQKFGLYPEHLDRYPRELSGGELQRAALARILVVEPELIVLDEPTSMLDAISQAQMIRMLQQIHEKENISYVFITHDILVAEHFCQKIYRIEDGRIMKEDSHE